MAWIAWRLIALNVKQFDQSSTTLSSYNDKAKPDERRATTGPRFLREAMDDSPKDPKTAEPPEQPIAWRVFRRSEDLRRS